MQLQGWEGGFVSPVDVVRLSLEADRVLSF